MEISMSTTITLTEGSLTVDLPGLTAVRIDTTGRVIAVDGTSGSAQEGPEWLVHDLRDGTYGDFHRLEDRGNCTDPDCYRSGQHVTAYRHVHDTVEELADCQECIDRAVELRVLQERPCRCSGCDKPYAEALPDAGDGAGGYFCRECVAAASNCF